ncbi:hypothetical protein J4457_06555 [Candidatus Woesearchaeota archaeon]|nr:hypothetical protein [Candidatus Woesearchaeota archaeon]
MEVKTMKTVNSKKMFSTLVLGLFLVSMVPLAFAEDDSTDNDDDANDDDDTNDDDRLTRREVVKERYENNKERREKTADKIKEIREDIAEHRAKVKEARENLAERREELKRICAEDPNSDACQDVKEKAKGDSKEFLLRSVDRILSGLDKMRDRVANSEWSQEDKDKATVTLDQYIADVEALKTKIEALTKENTRENYKAIAEELRAKWKEIKEDFKEFAKNVVNRKLDKVVERMNNAADKFEAIIGRLSEKGVDVTEAKSLLSDLRAKLDEAAAAEGREQHALLKEAHGILKKLNAEVMELRRTLKSENAGIVSGNEPESDDKEDDTAEATSSDNTADAATA